jgi:threonine synthase
MSFLTHIEHVPTGARLEPRETAFGDKSLLECRYDLPGIRRDVDRDRIARGPASIWRYRDLLPVDDADDAITLGEGWTPSIRTRALGLENLWIKDEGRNPSGTFKDRAASVALTRYRELGVARVAISSTGNAAASWALYAARAGIDCLCVIPSDGQSSCRFQAALSGAPTYLLQDWHRAGKVIDEIARESGRLNVCALREPYRTEGKKTIGLEIAEQFGWTLPDVIVYPTGGGLGTLAIWKAFDELIELGWIPKRLPRLVVTQYSGCAPVVKAYREGRNACEPWRDIDILSGGMKSPDPVSGPRLLELIRSTGGAAYDVTADEALGAVRELAAREGLFACPEGATTLVGLRKALADGKIEPGERVLLVNTGTGLKSIPVMPAISLETMNA